MNFDQLNKRACNIRCNIVRSLRASGSGHTGGSLGLADIFAFLYFSEMKHNPKEANWPERDRLVLSIGHVAPVLYAALAESGYFPQEELLSLRKLGSRLQGHPGRDHGLPGLELSAGSLGQGLSVAVGMALSARMDAKNRRTFCILGDGELQEGSVWEAAMSAGHYKLSNLIAIIDRNGLQIDGETENVMRLEPLSGKWEAFNWHVIHCDGNDLQDIARAFRRAHQIDDKPCLIIAKTKMGAGVKSIENDYGWHGKAPNAEQAEDFIQQIKKHHGLDQ